MLQVTYRTAAGLGLLPRRRCCRESALHCRRRTQASIDLSPMLGFTASTTLYCCHTLRILRSQVLPNGALQYGDPADGGYSIPPEGGISAPAAEDDTK